MLVNYFLAAVTNFYYIKIMEATGFSSKKPVISGFLGMPAQLRKLILASF